MLFNYQDLCSQFPHLHDRIVKEWQRVGGFVPYEQGYVYCIHACGTNYYKLGKTVNPDRRILQIAPQMPFGTRFIKVWQTNFMSIAEKWLHEEFAEFRANGEWFELPTNVIEGLVWSWSGAYSNQIKFAYGSTFFTSITESKEEFEVVKTYIEEASNYGVSLGMLGGGDPTVIAFIDHAFCSLSDQQFEPPADITADWKNNHLEFLKKLAEQGEQNG